MPQAGPPAQSPDPAADPTAALRQRLIVLRAGLIEKMAERVNGGELALLGSVQLAIDAVDAAERDAAA